MIEDALIIENLLSGVITIHYKLENGKHSVQIPGRKKAVIDGIGVDSLSNDSKLVHIPRKHIKASLWGMTANVPKYDITWVWSGALCEAVEHLSGSFDWEPAGGTAYFISATVHAAHALSSHQNVSYVIHKTVTGHAVPTSNMPRGTSIHGTITAHASVTDASEGATHAITGSALGTAALTDFIEAQRILSSVITSHAVLTGLIKAQHQLSGTVSPHATLTDAMPTGRQLVQTVTGTVVLSDNQHAQFKLGKTVTGTAVATATGITVVVAPHATLGLFMLGSATLGTV